MSTTEVGNQFEVKIFNLFSEELSQGRLFLKPETSKIFRKKGYYSRDRQKDIVLDISIEAYLPGEETWSFLIAIECKDYGKRVPVDDVEEFHSKLQQIGSAKAKGIVVSSKGFQEGALTFAQAKGIGLVRILDASNFKWILKRAATGFVTREQAEASKANIQQGLTYENYTSDHMDFFASISSAFTHSAKHLLELLTRDCLHEEVVQAIADKNRKQDIAVPYIRQATIEKQSSQLLEAVGYSNSEVPLDQICDYLRKEKDITVTYENDLGRDALGFEIFGKIVFDPTIVYISRQAHTNLLSRKFTLAHELGHYFMNHSQYMSGESYSEKDIEEESMSLINIEEIRRIEWQASHFASSLLLPEGPFVSQFNDLLAREEIKNKGYGPLFVDKQECNLNNFYSITNKLRDSFRVTRKVIEIRLRDLKLLNDVRG